MEKNNYKLPPLNSYLLKNIIFSMENQDTIGYLDLENAEVVEISDIKDPVVVKESKKSDKLVSLSILKNKDRFLALPSWGSIEGFKIREQFIKDVKNPVYKKTLNHVFHNGRGVFRKFKQILKENPIIERQWLEFKSNYMKAIVTNWYKECEGYVNLINLEEEIEELPNDLLVSDFRFSTEYSLNDKKQIDELKTKVLSELNKHESLIVQRRQKLLISPKYIVAYNLEEEIIGYIEWEKIDNELVEITSYGVDINYRGLGVLDFLIDKFIRQSAREKFEKVLLYKSEKLQEFDEINQNNKFLCNFGYSIIDIVNWNLDEDSSELMDV
jgi:ribosomal protein S18 acetylase RimI-like enzyme